MITKEQLKDWLDVDARKRYAEKLERRFDSAIKHNALQGITTFCISTGRVNNAARTHEKTPFYDLWHTKDLSEDNKEKVKREVLDKYRDHEFNVLVVNEDCGWHSSYEAIKFADIHKALEKSE